MNNRKPEVILIDGAELPVFQLDPDKEDPAPGCGNCNWHALSEEERDGIRDSVKEVTAKIRGRDGKEDSTHGDDQEG